MLAVKEAASQLNVSPQRVRALLKDGLLEGYKLGSLWVVEEDSVAMRKAAAPTAGRPKESEDVPLALPGPESSRCLYEQCCEHCRGVLDSRHLDLLSNEEDEFWVMVARFFLQKEQAKLIEAGVY